VKGVVNCVSSR